MMALMGRPERMTQSRSPCNQHPRLCALLLFFMFAPAIGLLIAVGRVLREIIPDPNLVHLLLAAPLLIALLVAGMLAGAIGWLLVMKRFVDKPILAKFFLSPPYVPAFSRLCSRMFYWAYRASS